MSALKKLKRNQLDALSATISQSIMFRAREHLLSFTVHTNQNYKINWHHAHLCNVLTKFARGEIKRLIVSMPPQRGKSELVSRRLPAFILGRNPNAKIVTASYASDLAAQMNRDVQRIIDSESYRELFPLTTLSGENVRSDAKGSWKRNSDEFEIVGHSGAYACAGVGGGLTGKSADFAIVDDPIKNWEEADSPTHREKIWNWYKTVLSTRVPESGGILITMTRWHKDDLVGKLLALAKSDPNADQWTVVEFPEVKENDDNPDDPRQIGGVLWPEKYSSKYALATKIRVGSRAWLAMYQQKPTSDEGTIFKLGWMQKRYTTLPEKFDRIIITADLRFKEDPKAGDHVVYQVWGKVGAMKYFIWEFRGRWSFTESVTNFKLACAKFPAARKKLIENKANGPALENLLKREISGLVLWEPSGSKVARANAVTPTWEAGDVWLPTADIFPTIDEVIVEWTDFGPGSSVDDRVDCMTMALLEFESGSSGFLKAMVS